MILIIGFRNYRENYLITGQYNTETNFHNSMEPKAKIGICLKMLILSINLEGGENW